VCVRLGRRQHVSDDHDAVGSQRRSNFSFKALAVEGHVEHALVERHAAAAPPHAAKGTVVCDDDVIEPKFLCAGTVSRILLIEMSFDRAVLRVAYGDADMSAKIGERLRTYGVVVIADVLSPAEADAHADGLVGTLEALSDGFSRDAPHAWKPEILPPMVRDGLFQSRLGAWLSSCDASSCGC
jgi:hypothetical protein